MIRKQQEEERLGKDVGEKTGDDNEQTTKTTRFAEGTNTESKKDIKKATLARDHSLGREYLQVRLRYNRKCWS